MTGNGFFSVPEHTPLIFTESSGTGRTLFRLLVSDASGENEGYLLAETVPNWAVDVTVKVLTEYALQPHYEVNFLYPLRVLVKGMGKYLI